MKIFRIAVPALLVPWSAPPARPSAIPFAVNPFELAIGDSRAGCDHDCIGLKSQTAWATNRT